jgi:hypothetical protein
MDAFLPLASLVVFAIIFAVFYRRFKENFFNLAAATDSKRSNASWAVLALVFTVVISVLWVISRHYR